MIVSDIITIPTVENISTEYIENEFKKLNIDPLRWAIVSVKDLSLNINVSYERK